MRDLIAKLTKLEATASKKSVKKMLKEDSTTPPINVSNKPASLKDIFETMVSGQAIPVVGKMGDTAQTGAGFLNMTDTSPAAQALGKAVGDLVGQKKLQIVVPNQPGAAKPGQPAPAGATGQPQVGQMQMKEKDEGKPGKNFAKIAKSAGERYGSKAAGERVAGAVRAKLAKQGKLEEEPVEESGLQAYLGNKKYGKDGMDALRKAGREHVGKEKMANIRAKYDKMDESQLDEKLTKSMSAGDIISDFEKSKDPKFKGKSKEERKKQALGAYYDMHPEKSKKKKTDEADIPSTQGIDCDGAGLGAGRSQTTLEAKEPQVEVIDNAFNRENYKDLIGKKYSKSKAPAYARVKEISEGAKPDFLDLDKDGNKKESMKKAAADKNKKKVKESMNHRISAARLEGKSHGLRGHAHSGKRYEDLDEIRAYHEGYKEGLDECYGQGVYETAPAMPPATVGGMASQALDEISQEKIHSYIDKAVDSKAQASNDIGAHRGAMAGRTGSYIPGDNSPAAKQRAAAGQVTYDKRNRGIDMAINKLAKEEEMDEGNAFTGALAKTPKGGKFSVGGKTFTDNSNLEEYAFEAWDRELSNLLNESEEVNEGMSVSISKGQQNSPDSVTITAQDQEADELLAFVKQAGLGLFGADKEPSSAMSIQPSHGAADEVGAGGVDVEVVDGHDGIMGLMQKLSGIQSAGHDDEDYADEEGAEEHTCNECGGMMEAGHEHTCSNCSDSSENNAIVDEFLDVTVAQKGMGGDSGSSSGVTGVSSTGGQSGATGGFSNANAQSGSAADADAAARSDAKSTSNESESEDQMEFEVAEDNAPDSETAEHNADEEAEAEEDMALAKTDQQNKTTTVNEGGDGGEASEEGPESKEGETDEEGETVSESFINLFKKLAFIAEESTAEKDDKAEKAGKKVTKDIEYDDKKDKKEKVDESQLDEIFGFSQKEKLIKGNKQYVMNFASENGGKPTITTDGYTTFKLPLGQAGPGQELYVKGNMYDKDGQGRPLLVLRTSQHSQYPDHNPIRFYMDDAGFTDRLNTIWAKIKAADKAAQPGQAPVNEWANQVGKGEGKGTDASFEQDIEFMTKVIAGGLNKPKSTGQTTIPVIAGQEDRMHDSPKDWATLAGIKK